MLKYHTCRPLVQGTAVAATIHALALFYSCVLRRISAYADVSLLCSSCVLKDLWLSVAQQVTAFSSRMLRGGG